MKHHLLIAAIFLLGGAIINVVTAWACIAARSTPWDEVEHPAAPDTAWLRASGLVVYDDLRETRLRRFGLLDSQYAAQVEPPRDPTKLTYYLYARRTRCGWPLLSLDGGRGSTIEFVEARGRYWFTGFFHIDSWSGREPAGLLFLGNGAAELGDLEYLPLRPIWTGFAVNSLFWAALLWLPFVVRRWVRVRRGLCLKCAYPTGESSVCTECGRAVRMWTVA